MPGDDGPRGRGHPDEDGSEAAAAVLDRAEVSTAGAALPGGWLDAIGEPAVGLTATGQVAVVNAAFVARLGLDPFVVVGAHHHDALGHCDADGRALPPERCDLCGLVAGGEPGRASLRLRAAGGAPVAAAVGPVVDGDGELARVVTFFDLTWWDRREQELSEQAQTDYLTGLPNRHRLHEALGALAVSRDTAAVLMVDLDDFKDVNDRFGHLLADELLTVVGQRLRGLMRGRDLVTRIGGDEFAAVLHRATLDQAREVAERIRAALEHPFDLGGQRVRIGASVGVSEPATVGNEHDRLLAIADECLREAKAGGKGCVVVAGRILREPDDVLPQVDVADARTWAEYIRAVRTAIAEAKEAGRLPAELAAPEPVHRTLLMLFEAVDALPDRGTADLPLPHTRRLIAFAIYYVAVLRWIDRLCAHGGISVPRPFAAERFWQHLESHVDKRGWGVRMDREDRAPRA